MQLIGTGIQLVEGVEKGGIGSDLKGGAGEGGNGKSHVMKMTAYFSDPISAPFLCFLSKCTKS